MSNPDLFIRVFAVMAERVRAGEPWPNVLADYGFGGLTQIRRAEREAGAERFTAEVVRQSKAGVWLDAALLLAAIRGGGGGVMLRRVIRDHTWTEEKIKKLLGLPMAERIIQARKHEEEQGDRKVYGIVITTEEVVSRPEAEG